MPLCVASIPFYARVASATLLEVDRGRVEPVLAAGGTLYDVITEAWLREALPSLAAGVTLTAIMLVSFSAMAGVVGGGGLGDLAIRYGYERFNTEVMMATVAVLVIIVQAIQSTGDCVVRRLSRYR